MGHREEVISQYSRVSRILVSALFVTMARSATAENVTFVGNSLTQHGPAAAIGWTGNWGMAASAQQLDYKNRVLAKLRERTTRPYFSSVVSSNAIEKVLLDPGLDAEPLLAAVQPQQDLIVLQIGDNILVNAENLSRFGPSYAEILKVLKGRLSTGGTLVCVGRWWRYPEVERSIQTECTRAGGKYVDLASIAGQTWAQARSERPIAYSGVGSHPGDRAMGEIAESILDVIDPGGGNVAK